MITALIIFASVLVACWLFWRYGTAMMLIGLFIAAARWNSDLTVDDAARNFYDDHDAERSKRRSKWNLPRRLWNWFSTSPRWNRRRVEINKAVKLLLFCLLPLFGCTFDTEPLYAPIAPGVNRLDHSDMELYREVWGDRLKEHRYRPRPEPQKLTVNGVGEPWLFVSNSQETTP